MLKKLALFTATTLLWVAPAQGRELIDQEVQHCELIGLTAKTVMSARQEGYKASLLKVRIMGMLTKSGYGHWRPVLDNIIEEAYGRPVFSTALRQIEIEVNFWMSWEDRCRADYSEGGGWDL